MTTTTLALEALKAMQSEAAARNCGLRICDEAIAALEAKPLVEVFTVIRRNWEGSANKQLVQPAPQQADTSELDELRLAYAECSRQRNELLTKHKIAASAPQQATATCQWTEDDPTTPDTYASECGELWSFIDGGVLENKVKFCHGCGARIEVVREQNIDVTEEEEAAWHEMQGTPRSTP